MTKLLRRLRETILAFVSPRQSTTFDEVYDHLTVRHGEALDAYAAELVRKGLKRVYDEATAKVTRMPNADDGDESIPSGWLPGFEVPQKIKCLEPDGKFTLVNAADATIPQWQSARNIHRENRVRIDTRDDSFWVLSLEAERAIAAAGTSSLRERRTGTEG